MSWATPRQVAAGGTAAGAPERRPQGRRSRARVPDRPAREARSARVRVTPQMAPARVAGKRDPAAPAAGTLSANVRAHGGPARSRRAAARAPGGRTRTVPPATPDRRPRPPRRAATGSRERSRSSSRWSPGSCGWRSACCSWQRSHLALGPSSSGAGRASSRPTGSTFFTRSGCSSVPCFRRCRRSSERSPPRSRTGRARDRRRAASSTTRSSSRAAGRRSWWATWPATARRRSSAPTRSARECMPASKRACRRVRRSRR